MEKVIFFRSIFWTVPSPKIAQWFNSFPCDSHPNIIENMVLFLFYLVHPTKHSLSVCWWHDLSFLSLLESIELSAAKVQTLLNC